MASQSVRAGSNAAAATSGVSPHGPVQKATDTVAALADLLTGELAPTTGFMMGTFKVSGDMAVALKLQWVV